MQRRKFITSGTHLGALLLIAPYLVSCKGKSKEEIKKVIEESNSGVFTSKDDYTITHVEGNVYTFEERGGTIGFYVTEDTVIIIDTQFPDQSQHLIDAISTQSQSKVDLLVNTHHHGDHTSGNIAYKDILGMHIAHENSLKNQKRVAEERDQKDVLYPTNTFSTDQTYSKGDLKMEFSYFGPAHTDGDIISFFANENVVHMGDLIFNRRFPFIDKSSGANISNWIKVLDQTLTKFDTETKYIFGHSANGHNVRGSSEDVKAFQNYLEKLLEFGMESKKAGKSLEEIKSDTKLIPGAEEWEGKGIDRSLDAVYAELNE